MSLIHPLWDPPARDAPQLQRNAYRYMMQALRRIATPIPEILSAPEEVSGARVMEAASATLLNPKIPHELLTGALKMLQLRMRSVDPATPAQLHLTRDAHRNTLAPDFGDQLAALTAFEDALHTFLLQRRSLETAPIGNVATERQALIDLGVLEALLITRLGWCSAAALAQVTGCVGQKPYVYVPWAWIDVEISGSNGTPQLRRLLLDPVTLAAWFAAHRHALQLPSPSRRLKAAKVAAFRAALARNAFNALVNQMARADLMSPIRSLRSLCAAETQRLYATTLPLLATYAKGDVASSSLHPDTWQRLLGCTVPDRGATRPPTTRQAGSESTTPLPTDLPVPGKVSNAEAAAEGDLNEDGPIDELRRIMNLPRGDWPTGFDTLIERLAAQGDNSETARFITSWLRYLATDYRSKGKQLHDGSIRYYRGLLANRLLECLPPSLGGVSEEELHDAYAEVIRSRTSPGQTRNLRMALGAFDRYIRTFQYRNLPHTQLFAADAGSYTISNRIISDADYQAGLKAIDDGSLVIANADVRQQARAFWVLAFRLGMRRREILGLQVRDIDDPFVRVRKNPARALKTPNAYRLLTLQPIPDSERAVITALLPDPDDRYPHRHDYVFFGPTAPSAAALDAHPIIAPVRALLQRITGDPHLHPHNLRHSFATLYLLGCLGSDFGLASHPCATGFMRDCIARATQLASVTAGRLHGKAARGAALGMLMGHGSELTTYEHYVHCLDLLLFVACTQPERPLRDVSPREQLARDRDEIRALLGRSASARLPGANVFAT